METQGRKEVCEAVLIAAINVACAALISFGVDELKKVIAKKQQSKQSKPAEDSAATP